MKQFKQIFTAASSPVGRASNQGTSWFRKSFGRIAVILVLAFFFITNANAQGTWVQKTNFTGNAREYAASFSIGSMGYIGTGWDGASDYRDFWQFNPATNAWTQKATFGGIAREEAVGFAIGGKGYIGTGWDDVNEVALGDLWEYDTLTNTWAEKASLPVNYERVSAVSFSIGTKGYIGTGAVQGYIDSKDLWEWDQASNTWSQKADMPTTTGRTNGIGFSIGTDGYIGTGFFFNTNDNSTTYFNDFYQWNQSNNTWTQRANIGAGVRIDAASFSIGNYGYIGTGYDNAQQNHDDFWAYNSINNTWGQQANVGTTVRWAGTGFSIGNKGYIGLGYSSTYLNDFWEFTPPCNSVAVTITPNGATTFNYPGTVSLDAGAFTSYLWSNLSTTESIIASISGNYSVTVTDVNGCTGVGSQAVTVSADTLNTPVLYGVTYEGGPHGYGNLFHYIAATNTVVIDTSYGGTGTDPNLPIGSLLEASNGKIYGTTTGGGTVGFGTLFEFAPATHTYLTKFNFDGAANGGSPTGGLIQASNGKIYGMTPSSGSNNDGIIFRYNPATSQLTVVANFDGTNTGMYPRGELVQANNGKLYGLASAGGAHSYGTLFQFDPVSNVITKIIDFDSTIYGMNPDGSLKLASNGKLYGMTYGGGTSHYFGTLFEFNPSTNSMVVDVNFGHINNSFANDNGESPEGNVIQANTGMMYGMTTYGNLGYGTLFNFNNSTNILTSLVSFDGYHEKNPMGSLMQASNGKIYGMAYLGGSGADGALFDYNPATNIFTTDINFTGTNGEFPEGSALIEYITTCTSYTPSITANGPTTICNGSSVILDGGTYSSYLWNTGATTEHLSITIAGIYSITVTDGSGCTGTSSQVVTVNANPSPVITPSGPTTICQGGSVTLDAGAWASYIWSDASTDESLTANTSGTYTVTVTDVNGCTGTASQDVTVNPNPTPIITPSGPTTLCFGYNGILTLDAGAGYASYNWNPSSTDETITATGGGIYSVYVTDNNDCLGYAQIIVTVNQPATISITPSGPTTICQGNTITLDAGQGFTTYYWYGVAPSSTDETVSAGNAGDYQVQVTDANGCISLGDIFVTVNPSPTPTISASGSTNLCQGDSVSLDAGAYSSYHWSIGATDESVEITLTGDYGVTVTDNNGCTAIASQLVNVFTNPSPSITAGGPTTFCQGGSVSLDAGSFAAYMWSDGATDESDIVMNSGTYTVTVTDDIGCMGMASQVVNVNPSPAPVITANGSTSFCQGGSVTLDAGIWSSYSWIDGNTVETDVISSNGTYTITVTDSIGCTGMASQVVTVNPNPSPSITPNGPTTFNQGGNVILDAGSYSTYTWSTGATDESIDVTTSGTYLVTVTDANGCIGMNSIIVTVNPLTCSIIPNGSTTFCEGGSVLLDAGVGASYMWSDGSTDEMLTATTNGTYTVTITDSLSATCVASIDVIVNQNPSPTISGPSSICDGNSATLDAGTWASYLWSTTDITETISVNTSDTYIVTVSDINGCTGMASQFVTVFPNPVANFTVDVANGCSPLTVHFINQSTNGISYYWSFNDGSHSTDINPTHTFYGEADYYITLVVYGANGCSDSISYEFISVYATPYPTITPSGPINFCNGDSVTLDAGSWFSYIWSNGSTDETITVTSTGTYTVTVTEFIESFYDGCPGITSQVVTVNQNLNPSITPSGATTFCAGGSVSLDAGLWASYDWSNGDSSEAITVSTSGTYSLTIMDGNGCMGMASQAITVNTNPTPSITPSGATTFCDGGSVLLDAGSWAAYNWSTGDSSESITASSSGTYSVTITDGNGCNGMASQAVTVNTLPVATIQAASLSLCQGSTDMLIANVTGGSGVYTTYTWTPGVHPNSDTAVLNAATVGVKHWEVVVTDDNGCSSIEDTVTVVVNSNPSPAITPNGNTTFCSGGSVMLDAGSWSSYNWSTGASTESINVSANGTYSVTISNSNGCSGNASIVITVNNIPSPTITANGSTSFCDGSSVGLDAGSYSTYLWNTGETTEAITVFGSQPYCVTVTDANGCTNSNCIFINVLAVPTASISGPSSICNGNSAILNSGTATSYIWSNGATTQSTSVNTSGNYCVTVSNSLGCTASTCHSFTVSNAIIPNITANGPTTICQNSNVTLDAGSGYSSYIWSNGASTETITVNTSNVYKVTVSNATGCTGSASQIVAVSPSITGLTIVGATSACGGSTVTINTASTYGSYLWSNGATTQAINVTATGIFYVTVSNGGNCTAVAHHSVTIQVNPVPVIVPTSLSNVCGGGNATLTVSSVYSTYVWNVGATTQGIMIDTGGTYSVTVLSTNGCTGTSSIAVTGACNIPVIAATPTTNILPTGGMANWIPPTCFYNYTIRISLHNANNWTSYTFPPNSHYMFSQLLHNTAYDWQIQTNCNSTGTINSGFSTTQTFTTALRLDNETGTQEYAFTVYPNPANDHAIVAFTTGSEDNYNIRLVDITGRIIQSINYTSVIGENQYQLNLSSVAKGVYMVILQNKNDVLQSKIVVQ